VNSRPSSTEHQAARGWVSIKTAAEFLDMSPNALRRSIERHVVRAPDGGMEANIDGVRARKLAGRWRVKLSAAWLVDTESEHEKRSARCATSPSSPKHAVRPERS
jgi:hypothetical protein